MICKLLETITVHRSFVSGPRAALFQIAGLSIGGSVRVVNEIHVEHNDSQNSVFSLILAETSRLASTHLPHPQAATRYLDGFFMFGGYTDLNAVPPVPNFLNDMWYFNFSSRVWKDLTPKSSAVMPITRAQVRKQEHTRTQTSTLKQRHAVIPSPCMSTQTFFCSKYTLFTPTEKDIAEFKAVL
jgi:hypothetical protein